MRLALPIAAVLVAAALHLPGAHDQALAVTGELGDWWRVQMSPKETGWIAKHQARDTAEATKGEMPVPTIAGAPVVKLFQNAPPVIAEDQAILLTFASKSGVIADSDR